jgi:hypothetical protein
MFSTFTPPQSSIALTFVTARLIIQGTVQTRFRRAEEVFNQHDILHLVVLEAIFMELGSRRVVAEAAVAQVALEDVLFAHTSGPAESVAEMRVPKQPVRATLLLPPFTVTGEIQLAHESEMRIAMEAYEGRFMPVSPASYWGYSVAESPVQVDLLLVNHAKAHIAVSSTSEWRSEAPQVDKSKDLQKPW